MAVFNKQTKGLAYENRCFSLSLQSLKMHIWTNVWSAQHPYAGQNRQVVQQYLKKVNIVKSLNCLSQTFKYQKSYLFAN